MNICLSSNPNNACSNAGVAVWKIILVTELISLKTDDVNLSSGYIKVRKRNNERHIPLGNHCLKCLKEYMNKVRPLLIRTEEEKTLFINTKGQKMTRQGYWKILKQYSEQAKINKEIGWQERPCWGSDI